MADIFSTILTVLLVVVSILMIIIILLQSNRAAGGMFASGAQTAFGAGSADALTKITGGFAAAFLLICFGLAALKSSKRATDAATEQLNKEIPAVTAPTGAAAPAGAAAPSGTPAAAPAAGQAAKPAAAAATPAAPAAAKPAPAAATAPAAGKPK
ncbi:MAG: preprotein translocase subunit SecG [Turneriella sp.]